MVYAGVMRDQSDCLPSDCLPAVTADGAPVDQICSNSDMIQLGCIAGDFTGATDLANNLVRGGMRVLQTVGVPDGPLNADVDAVVVALKSRTIAPQAAVALSLDALEWLKRQGARQIYF